MSENDQQQPSSDQTAVENESAQGGKDLFRALLLCLLIVIIVRSFIFEPFKIPSSSMVPTLRIGDHIFVSKFSYGLSVPFTKIQFLKWAEPERGDVIVFLFPKEESLYYVKRIVGVPGDKVEIKGTDIYVNDTLVPKEAVKSPEEIQRATGSTDPEGDLFRENVADHSHYVIYRDSAGSSVIRNRKAEVIPEGHFFVMGDNRDDSYDSRGWGSVPRENIKGKAKLIWLSLDKTHGSGLGKVRWDRFFTVIK